MAAITEQVTINLESPTCSNPFYIRWWGSPLGHHYWLFNIEQTVNIEHLERGIYENILGDFSQNDASIKSIGVDSLKRVGVRADMLTYEQWEMLNSIVQSHRVHWYDDGVWRPIVPVRDTKTTDKKKHRHEISLEFYITKIFTID